MRVLLADQASSAKLSGAVQAGDRKLDPSVTYTVKRHGLTQVDLSASGKRLATFDAPLQVAGNNGITSLSRQGLPRHPRVSPGLFGGVQVINGVGLEDYLQGVVPSESPASWPAAALQAQAIAARTYAITTAKASGAFDEYADTRSQVYGGVSAETTATDQAVADTRGQVVTYNGQPVVTYFFSTSGGKTEDVENTNLGDAAGAVAEVGRRPLRQRVAAPPLDAGHDVAGAVGKKLARALQGLVPRHQGAAARRLAADHEGAGARHARLDRDRRRDAARQARPVRHVGVLHERLDEVLGRRAALVVERSTAPAARPARVSRVGGPVLSGSVIGGGSRVTVQQQAGGRWSTSAPRAAPRRYRWSVPRAGTYRVVAVRRAAGPAVRPTRSGGSPCGVSHGRARGSDRRARPGDDLPVTPKSASGSAAEHAAPAWIELPQLVAAARRRAVDPQLRRAPRRRVDVAGAELARQRNAARPGSIAATPALVADQQRVAEAEQRRVPSDAGRAMLEPASGRPSRLQQAVAAQHEDRARAAAVPREAWPPCST